MQLNELRLETQHGAEHVVNATQIPIPRLRAWVFQYRKSTANVPPSLGFLSDMGAEAVPTRRGDRNRGGRLQTRMLESDL